MTVRLNRNHVAAASYGKEDSKQDIRWDSVQPGFGLRLYPSGKKAFVASYRVKGRKRIVSLGSPNQRLADDRKLTVQVAREEAEKLIVAAREGADLRERPKPSPTIADLASRYLTQHAAPKKKPRSLKEDERLLNSLIIPKLGRREVDSLTREQVGQLHHSLRDRPYAANRVLALLSKMMNLAEAWGLRTDGTNPCRHIERFPEKKRERFLSGEGLARLGKVLEDSKESPTAIAAIRLLILTGCRKNEVLQLRWDKNHVDLENGLLHLEDTKTGKKTVPLAAPARELLANLPRESSNPYVFPGVRKGKPFVGLHRPWARIREEAELDDVRIHDLRHTFASFGAGVGLSLPIIGKLLGHSHAATTQRYAHLATDPMQEAAGQIASQIDAALRGQEGAVIPMRPKNLR